MPEERFLELGDNVTTYVNVLTAGWKGIKLSDIYDVDALISWMLSNVYSILRGYVDIQEVVSEIVLEDVYDSLSDTPEGKLEIQVISQFLTSFIKEIISFLETHIEDIHNVRYDILVVRVWPSGRVVLKLTKGTH